MVFNRRRLFQAVGIAGTTVCLIAFGLKPSFPTPDKLFVFFFFVFCALSQAREMTKRILPFVAIILVYESFRSLADRLNTHVNYTLAPHLDRILFGQLPTKTLQHWLWRGHVQWYDIVFYMPYLFFFIAPMLLAVLIWKTRDKYYWQTVASFSLLFFLAFATFVAFPAAPPWLAAQHGVISGVERISSSVWAALGIQNFPSVYNHLSPNPVAAVPSLHAAVSTLTSIYIFKLYGRRWGAVSALYPLILCFGIIYEGEHYFSDVAAGLIYAMAAYWTTPRLMAAMKRLNARLRTVVAKVS